LKSIIAIEDVRTVRRPHSARLTAELTGRGDYIQPSPGQTS
jgi:hypothetical protein